MADENRDNEVTNEIHRVERALAALVPRASNVDRDKLLFLAGQRSAEVTQQRSTLARWGWPVATCVSTAAALVFAALLIARPQEFRDADAREATNIAARQNTPEKSFPRHLDPSVDHQPEASANRDLSSLPQRQPRSLAEANLLERPSYLRLREFVLAYGFNAVPERERPEPVRSPSLQKDASPRTQRELIEELLNFDSREENRS